MKIIECSRDAMQGIETFIPTNTKADYINTLLKAGFDTIDFGSFVSPKAVPQMKDTAQVLSKLDLASSKSNLLAIVANVRGAKEACSFEEIGYLGYPMSISDTFQIRNTNKNIADSFNVLNEIANECSKKNRKLVAYISMGFGNPYGDPYDPEIVLKFSDIISAIGINTISLSDTIGVASIDSIDKLFKALSREFPAIEFGCHLHSDPHTAPEKIKTAFFAGCRRLDGAIKGFGGCPMAEDELVGNIPTETILAVLEAHGENTGIDKTVFTQCMGKASLIFDDFS